MNAAFTFSSIPGVQLFSNGPRSLARSKKMKTLTTSLILSVMFLSAGAFAGANRTAPHLIAAPAKIGNVTTVNKNGVWPPPVT